MSQERRNRSLNPLAERTRDKRTSKNAIATLRHATYRNPMHAFRYSTNNSTTSVQFTHTKGIPPNLFLIRKGVSCNEILLDL